MAIIYFDQGLLAELRRVWIIEFQTVALRGVKRERGAERLLQSRGCARNCKRRALRQKVRKTTPLS
jgi:hypothetical protein